MSVPPSVDTRVVQGTYVDGAGVARQGSVTFRLDQPLIAEAESWGIVPTPIIVQLDASGHFSQELMASDDLALFPSGFRWIVQERFQGGYVRTYSFELPTGADPLDLPTATQYDPGDVGLAVVHSVNGRTGIVQFGPSDFAAIPLVQKGAANGVATLNSGGVIPPEQLSPGYLEKQNNLSDVNSVSTSRNNLGLGTAATHNVGWSPGQVILGEDTRLSDARTPTAHASTHAGAGSDPIVPASIGASAVGHTHAGPDVTSGTVAYNRLPVGTTVNTVTAGNDARLTDQRTPTDLSVTTAKIVDGAVTSAKIADGTIVNADISPTAAIVLSKLAVDPLARANHTGTQLAATISNLGTAATKDTGTGVSQVILGNDSRLTNARTPTAHAASHAAAGSDPVTPNAIGADPAGSAASAVSTHSVAVDPHGDRAYTDSTFAGALTRSNNLSDVNSVSAARTSLGLGTAATRDTGTGATNVVLGNDARLTDSRAPGAHASTHATGGSDPVTAASIGASATGHVHAGSDVTTGTVAYARLPVGATINTVAAGDDSRFTDQRTPVDNSVTSAKIVDGTIVNADISGAAGIALSKLGTDPLARANHTGTQLAATISDLGTAATKNTGTGATNVILGNDSRLTDARTPTTHASSHSAGGSDPVTPSSVGAVATAGGSTITNVSLGNSPLILKGAASQSASLFRIQDSTATDLVAVSSAGALTTQGISATGAISATGTLTAVGGTWSGSPTLVTPTVASFANSAHTHANAAGGGFISMPRVRVKRTGSTFSLNSATDSTITFTGFDILIGGTWWTSGTTITAPTGATGQAVGIVRALFQASGTNGGIRKAQLVRTSDSAIMVEATQSAPGGSSTAWMTVNGSDTFNITAGDQFTMHIYHEAGAALTINDMGCSIYLIGA